MHGLHLHPGMMMLAVQMPDPSTRRLYGALIATSYHKPSLFHSPTMPLYELLCLAKPALSRPDMVSMIHGIGSVVYKHGGFITDLKSYGEQSLAYDIRRPFERYHQAAIWQMDFLSPTTSLKDLDHSLHVNEQVLRWVVVKRPRFKTPIRQLLSQALQSGSPRPPADKLQTEQGASTP